jgi:membrane-bound lytic murein transglycosylase D
MLAMVALAGCAVRQHPAAAPDPAPAPVAAVSPAPIPAVVAEGVTSTEPVTGPTPAQPRPNPGPTPAPPRPDTGPTVVPAGGPAATTIPVSTQEVARQTVAVFGDSSFAATATADSAATDEPTWDMDVRSYETQDRVAHYVSMFSGRSKEHITSRLEHGTRYEAMIRAKFKAGGLPEDMYYLALVESGFDPNAYSRAAAVGMWQFMTSTGRGMGMRIDWWVDERRDPVRSTTAAVRFIRGLRDQFGSLYLAAAAYNGGPGRVARGLAKYSDDLENTQQAEDAFFVLAEKDYLRNETREYVPQLIAAALIAKEPKRYGMTLHPREPFAYDSVKVPASTPLLVIAKAAGSTIAEIRDLNPHLLRGMTPPRISYLVRIPPGSGATFDSLFSAIPKAAKVATRIVESKKGDTVDRLAEKHRISSRSLIAFNPNLRRLKPSGRLVPGQAILIPSPSVASAALNVPDPSIEKYARGSKRLKVHTVKRGETVRSIARKYDTTPERIMKLNGMKKAVVFAGQSLVVSSTGGKARKSSASRSAKKKR